MIYEEFFQKLIIIVSILVSSLSISFAQTDSATGKIYFLGNPKGVPGEIPGVYGFETFMRPECETLFRLQCPGWRAFYSYGQS